MSTSTLARASHHHGDLRRALVDAGRGMLEAGEPFSLRAVARKVGVSQTAPYRHFADKEHLEAAMAAQGFNEMNDALSAIIASADGLPDVTDLALAYVHYAADHPAMYRLMFAQACGDVDERLVASARVFQLLEDTAAKAYPQTDAHALATAGWAMAHGLASLHLDGKLTDYNDAPLDDRIREAFSVIAPRG